MTGRRVAGRSDAVTLEAAAARLTAAGVEDSRREARRLLALARGGTGFVTEVPPEATQARRFATLVARRAEREPFAYLSGEREFWSLPFLVGPATLVPRPDSETLVEAALDLLRDDATARVLDLGTGTGCLLLAVLSERARASGVGIDRVPEAAALARRNARRLGLAHRAGFLAGDWAAALAPGARFQLVVCNPPYVERAAIPTLQPEVALYEPAAALDGGPDGLDAYRAVLATLRGLLAADGRAVLELGRGQRPAVTALARAAGLVPLGTRADLSRTERALILAPTTLAK